MVRVFTTFCAVFACIVCSGEAGTTVGMSTGTIGNDSTGVTSGLSGVSPTEGIGKGVSGAGEIDGSADGVSTSTASVSSPTTHDPTPVDATSVIDVVTTVDVAVSADVDNSDMSPDSATDAVTPGSDTTTHSGTTQHLSDDIPVVTSSPASKVKKNTKVNDITSFATMLADDATLTTADTPGGVTQQPPIITSIDDPVATESVALDDPDNDADTRLRKNLGGALMPVYVMTSFFLERIVQPHYVTQLKINLTQPEGVLEAIERQWTTWAVYFVGFLVCASIGVVLSILTPCVGLCIACCRCGGRCGGKIDFSDGRRAKCQRICCGLALLIIMAALVVAVVAVFALNERLREQLRADGTSSFDDVKRSIGDVDGYINTTKNEFLTQVVHRCSQHIDGLTTQAGRLPGKFVDELDDSAGVRSALTRLREVADGLRNFTADLNETEHKVSNLRNQTQQLRALLDDVKTKLLADIANCNASECIATRERVDRLNVTSDFSKVSLRDLVLLEGVMGEGLVNVTDAAQGEIDGIRTAVNDSISSHLVKYRETAEEAQHRLDAAVREMLTHVDKVNLSYATRLVDNSKELAKGPAYIVYCCVASLALLVCFIVLCTVIGLAYGSFSRRATLTSEGPCDADRSVGANWLLAGVGFTFIFYLLLAVATTALFLAGGLTHTEVCRHLVDFDNPRSAEVIELMESSVTIPSAVHLTSVYGRCRENESLYSAASLETTTDFNASRLIDMRTVREFVDGVKNLTITVRTIPLLSPALEVLLQTPTNITEMCDLLGADVITDDDLAWLSEKLKNTTRHNTTDGANQLHEITERVTAMRETAKSIVVVLRNADGFINASVDTVGLLNNSLKTMNNWGNATASTFINRTADNIYIGIQALRTDLERRIRNDIGRCRPVYDAVTTAIDTTCIKVLYPINGVWFCLGCCIFLLLPSVILSFKLVTLYRKLDPYDESPYEYADPIYDAYRPSDYHDFGDQPREMLIQKLDATRPRSYEPLGPVDNPVYMMDSEVELTGPPDNNRPQFFSPGYPVYAKPAENRAVDPGRPSPPPSYASSTGGAEISYDTRL